LYGYTWSDAEPYAWIDLSSPSDDTGLAGDEQVKGPYSIGFPFGFPFYENVETQVYISTNGLLLFGSDDSTSSNRGIPFVGLPNRFIAPFWDDLEVDRGNGGGVYAHAFGDKFVVLWKQITRYKAPVSDLLTFEAILYPDGNVCYQYQQLNGELTSASVGIEDPDGVDGLTYLYNSPGLGNLLNKRLCFSRPGPNFKTKVLPIYQGQFTEDGVASFSLNIRNIGSLGPDAFDIKVVSMTNPWSAKIYDDGNLQLTDTDGNGSPNTRQISAGESVNVKVNLVAPTNAVIGANTELTLAVSSAHDPSQKREVRLQAAVPTAFGQAVKNSDTGVDLSLIWLHDQRSTTLSRTFTGSNLAVATLLNSGYMYIWERNEDKAFGDSRVNYTDIEYSIISLGGFVIQPPSKLTNNFDRATTTQQTSDTSPTLAVDSSGRVGITWVREILDTSNGMKTKSNIYFKIFNLSNPQVPILEETSVTGNEIWLKEDNPDAPTYGRPKIKSTSDGHFVLTWEEKRDLGVQISEENVALAVYSSNGAKDVNPKLITNSLPGQILYREPGMAELSGNKVFVTYSEFNTTTKLNKPSYQVFDSAGLSQAGGNINNVNGWLATATKLGNANILMAWTQGIGGTSTFDTQIGYILIDGNSYQPLQMSAQVVSTPDSREADYVSASIDGNGNGILTWIDVDLKQGLYYALINQDGSVKTPAIAFNSVGLNSALVINDSGYSLASYMGSYLTHLPLTVKR
jgi:hypothetical protein